MQKSPYIFAVDVDSFEGRVLQASVTQPVLVDFWAEWCPPVSPWHPLWNGLWAFMKARSCWPGLRLMTT